MPYQTGKHVDHSGGTKSLRHKGHLSCMLLWLLVYASLVAAQYLVFQLPDGPVAYLLNGGLLLAALLGLYQTVSRRALYAFLLLMACLDGGLKIGLAGVHWQPAVWMSSTLALQAWLGFRFLQLAGQADAVPDTQKETIVFSLNAAVFPVLISSFLLSLALVFTGSAAATLAPASFGAEFLWWFLSRFTSVVLVAPVIIFGLAAYRARKAGSKQAWGREFWLLAGVSLASAFVLFAVGNPPGRELATYSYLLIPVMLVVAVRLPLNQSLLVLLLVAVVSFVVDTTTSLTPGELRRSMMALAVFLCINCAIVWHIGALIAERARSLASEKKQKAMYEMLSRVNQTIINPDLDQAGMFALVCQIILDENDYQQVCITYVCEATEGANGRAPNGGVCYRQPGKAAEDAGDSEHCELVKRVLSGGEPVVCQSCDACPQFRTCQFKPLVQGSMAAFPVVSDGHVVAVFSVFSIRYANFDEASFRLFREMADNLGFAVAIQLQRIKLIQAYEAFEHSRESIIISDTRGTILNVNPSFTRLTGYAYEEAVGKNPRILQSGRQDKTFYQHLFAELKTRGFWSGQFWNKRKNGEYYLQRGTISAVFNANSQPEHYIAIMEDVTAQLEAEEKIQSLANYDQLTGLPNRSLFKEYFTQAVGHAQRAGLDWALLFIDLDNFKQVNDALGHHYGDELLKEVSSRLARHIRETDILCRFGGDEFILLMQGGAREAAELARRLIDEISRSYNIQRAVLQVGASIGIALLLQDGETLDELIQAADTAMYQAKNEGRGTFKFFARTMQDKVQTRLILKQALQVAIEEDQLCLFYQPKVVCSPDGQVRVVGYEALVRWQHPEKGRVSPAEFIPAA